MVGVKGTFEGYVEVGEPSPLEIQGLIKVMEKILKRYTEHELGNNFYIRDNTFKDRYYEIELEEGIEAGFLENNQYIESIFRNMDGDVLLKVYEGTLDEYIFYEVKL